MQKEILSNLEKKMDFHINHLLTELKGLRAGKASLSMLDKVRVDYYGTITPVSQIGTLSLLDARTIVIQPWEASLIPEIEKAVRNSDLGVNPSNDGKVVRVTFPQLTEERRKDLVKVVKKVGEEAKITMRNSRRDANDEIKELKKNNEISEDDSKKFQDTIQKITDQHIKRVDEIIAKKEEDIMEV